MTLRSSTERAPRNVEIDANEIARLLIHHSEPSLLVCCKQPPLFIRADVSTRRRTTRAVALATTPRRGGGFAISLVRRRGVTPVTLAARVVAVARLLTASAWGRHSLPGGVSAYWSLSYTEHTLGHQLVGVLIVLTAKKYTVAVHVKRKCQPVALPAQTRGAFFSPHCSGASCI
jgi:hypothetical protein